MINGPRSVTEKKLIFVISFFTGAFAMFAVSTIFFPQYNESVKNVTPLEWLLFLGVFVSVSVSVRFVMRSSSFEKIVSNLTGIILTDNDPIANYPEIERRLISLELQQSSGLTDIDQKDLAVAVASSLSVDIDDKIISKIKEEHGAAFLNSKRFSDVDIVIGEIIAKLMVEKTRLNLWTFLNLISGVIAASSGVYLLYSMVGDLNIAEADPAKFPFIVLGFIARLSLVIIIEIFAYFFLNLYRTGIQEIKFYQNEITNALSHQAAMRAALIGDDKVIVSYAIKKLLDTERNFILQKGESTTGILQQQIDRDGSDRMMEGITSAVKAAMPAAKA